MDTIAWNGPDGQLRLTVCIDSVDMVVIRLIQEGRMLPGTEVLVNPTLPEGKPRAWRILNGRVLPGSLAIQPPTVAQRLDAAKTIDELKSLLKEIIR